MNETTLRPVSTSMPPTRSSRMVVWNLRRIVTTRSLSPSWVSRRSALVMPSCVTHKTTFRGSWVRALVGPRPVYSANSRTTCLLTAAVSEPGVRSCVSVLDVPASALESLYVQAARKGLRAADRRRARRGVPRPPVRRAGTPHLQQEPLDPPRLLQVGGPPRRAPRRPDAADRARQEPPDLPHDVPARPDPRDHRLPGRPARPARGPVAARLQAAQGVADGGPVQ